MAVLDNSGEVLGKQAAHPLVHRPCPLKGLRILVAGPAWGWNTREGGPLGPLGLQVLPHTKSCHGQRPYVMSRSAAA